MSASLFCPTCGFAIPAQATSCAACGAAIVVDAEAAPPPVQTPLSSPAPTPPLFAASTPAVCSLPAGYLLAGRYRILQQIGQGGFATVYKAQDRGHKNRLVAIKQIHLESLSLQEMIDASDGYNREVTHLSSLRHKSLPRIYDYFTDEQHWYIAMEYLTGKTLEERLKSTRRGFLPVKRTLDIGLALCDVFHYLHTQRPPIIFRDIKPANIIITRSGRICLIDFGIARLYRPGRKDTGPLGTLGYAAPEQYGRRAHTTPQTDIYGLGATLQTLLTGKEPLEITQDGIPPKLARAIPTDLQNYLARMLERDATRRPHNMVEVKQTLQEIKAQRPVQKIKAASAFLWGLRKEISGVSFLFLLLLLLLDLFSITGLVWPLLWPLSLLFLVLLAVARGLFALRQARAESAPKLTGRETITILWRQLVSSAPLTFLLYFPFYIVDFLANLSLLGDSSHNPLPDLILLGVYAGGGLIAGLIWLIYQMRISRRQAVQRKRQQQPQKLEEPLVQKVHNRARP
jgi:tRNA A-37 threonylcarbamoyl transferase component Bud32